MFPRLSLQDFEGFIDENDLRSVVEIGDDVSVKVQKINVEVR